ncbi:RNA 2'-phosphotransferase [Pendulispora albinea]|uniref:Probable RNA 2'-phosphotransferase n=1 Tax=Pendulispora albinea TaxID=2741071 RepID=A0ABZ2MC28_9BACT
MDRARATRISKLLAFALRHDPGALGLDLDGAGWTDVAKLLGAIAARGEPLSHAELTEIVRASDKQRFAISEDGTRIRANQGHSVAVDLGLAPREPPVLLYHGTVARFLASIRQNGLLRGSRTHVHLSVDTQTAEIVAHRRSGPAVILTVHAGEMHAAGRRFWRSENGVWLTDHVPPAYLRVPG